MPGARCDDHGVAGPRGFRPAGDGDDAFAGRDQQDLFDLVGVFGDCLTAGREHFSGPGWRAGYPALDGLAAP